MPPLATVRVRHLRRRVLDVLRAAARAGGEGRLGATVLFEYLFDEIDGLSVGEVRDAVTYLGEKGYVEVTNLAEHRGDPARLAARLSATGIDLLDETIPPDPGVEDPRA